MDAALERFYLGYNLELANVLNSGRFGSLSQASDYALRCHMRRASMEETKGSE
jgi:hypothetical protein